MLSRGTPQLAKSAIFYGTEIYSVNVGGGGTPFQTDCANTFLTASIIHAQLPLRNCEKKRYTTYCNTYHLRFNRALTRLGFSSMIIKGGIRPCVSNNNKYDKYQVWQWSTCGLLVVYQWSTSGLLVVYLWSTCGLLVVYLLSTCGGLLVVQQCHILSQITIECFRTLKFPQTSLF